MDVWTQSQALWLYLCTLLQYWEDKATILECKLFGGKTQRPSALVLYFMYQVNLGLEEGFQVEWASIVGCTPWLAIQEHLATEELQQFYDEPGPEVPSELELITEDVWHHTTEEAAWRNSGNPSVAPSRVEEAQPRDSPGQQQQQPTEPEERRQKFQPGPSWIQVPVNNTGLQDMVSYHTPARMMMWTSSWVKRRSKMSSGTIS